MINKRLQLIHQISEKRNSNVISYVTGDRKNIGTRIAPDIIPVFYGHLKELDPNKPIDLILYTKGGDVLTAQRLVDLIYEFTENFSVLIPHKAFSSGTLVCLGASEVIMGKMSEMSPVDPKVSGPFNPKDPNNPNTTIPISVEDVSAYFTLTKEMIGLEGEESLTKTFSLLTQQIHPLAIGSVYRTHFLIRSVARKLLNRHINSEKEEMISNIVDKLTKNLYSHDYMITRNEAKNDLQLPISYPEPELENIIWSLYKKYRQFLELDKPFNPQQIADRNGNFNARAGIIESADRTDIFEFHGNIAPPNNRKNEDQPNISILNQGWSRQRR